MHFSRLLENSMVSPVNMTFQIFSGVGRTWNLDGQKIDWKPENVKHRISYTFFCPKLDGQLPNLPTHFLHPWSCVSWPENATSAVVMGVQTFSRSCLEANIWAHKNIPNKKNLRKSRRFVMFISLTFWFSAEVEKEKVSKKTKKRIIICENLRV